MQALERDAELMLRGLDRAHVLLGMGLDQPGELIGAVIREARRRRIELVVRVADLGSRWSFIDADALADVRSGSLRLELVAGGVPRRLAPWVDQVVGSMWDVDRMITSGDLPVDLYLARLNRGRQPGQATFGEMVGYGPAAMAVAKRVGVELVGGRCPHFVGEPEVDLAGALVVHPVGDSAPRSGVAAAPSREQVLVAQRVAALLPDGATLQTGLGAIPAALFSELADRRDLGVHSGILPVDLQALLRSGVITGDLKGDARGLTVATGVMGGNVAGWGVDVRLEPISLTHDPARLRGLRRFWAINSAFEVDLFGQVNAEYVAGARLASGGGQTDFLRAARGAVDGAAVVALPVRTPHGSPRIVTRLPTAHRATASGVDLDWVVTDFGAAYLPGRNTGDRALALIEIAHPDDRSALRIAWRELQQSVGVEEMH